MRGDARLDDVIPVEILRKQVKEEEESAGKLIRVVEERMERMLSNRSSRNWVEVVELQRN